MHQLRSASRKLALNPSNLRCLFKGVIFMFKLLIVGCPEFFLKFKFIVLSFLQLCK